MTIRRTSAAPQRRRRPPSLLLLAVAAWAGFAAFAGIASAHPHIFFDIGIAVCIGPEEGVRAEFTLIPNESTCMAMILEGDTDDDFAIAPDEVENLRNIWRAYFKKFKYFARFRNGETAVPLTGVTDFNIQPLTNDPNRFCITFAATATLPDRDLGDHALEVDLTDQTIYASFTIKPDWCTVSPESAALSVSEVRVLGHGRGIHVEYALSPEQETAPDGAERKSADVVVKPPVTVTPSSGPAGFRSRFYAWLSKGMDRLTGLLSDLSPSKRGAGPYPFGALFSLLAFALLYGIIHAMGPGHGKALVAAFLVRGQTRPVHALALSLIVTLTHTGTALLLAAGVQLLKSSVSRLEFRDIGQAWIGLGSGLLVMAIGLFPVALLLSRAITASIRLGGLRAGFSAAWSQSTQAEQEEAKVTTAQIAKWGIAAGLVPCPASIVIMLLAIGVNAFWVGLMAVVALALGLSAVLLVIGLSVVYSREGLMRRLEGSRWSGRLAILFSAGGAVLIVGLGLFLVSFYAARLDTLYTP